MRVHLSNGRVVEAETEAFVAALIERLAPADLAKVVERVEELNGEQELVSSVASRIIRPS